MSKAPNYISVEGFNKLQRELQHLMHTARPEAVDQVAIAAAHGDRSENAEYIYGKKKLREIDRRIRFLARRLDDAEIVRPPTETTDRVFFGATVEVEDEEEARHTYRLVGADEIDPGRGWVSWKSPVGRALTGKQVGDEVAVQTPGGTRWLSIEAVRYSEA